MSKRANLYLGRAGQMAVMAEYLARGWNVAVPEVMGLYEEYKAYNIGSLTNNKLMLTFNFSDNQVTCSERNLTHYLNNWKKWPLIAH